jgi:uncharacterized protein (TIGR02453 family)
LIEFLTDLQNYTQVKIMPAAPTIPPELFTFLRQLKKHNNREWFQKNKSRFEKELRDPLLKFIEAFEPHLKKIAPHYVASAKKSGGSLFRIYRDTRFSHDKKPYKENAGLHFRHERGKDVHTPGFYLHLSPEECFAGAGIWKPQAATAHQIRNAIAADSDRWQSIMRDRKFKRDWVEVTGDKLKRPPQGFAADHPLIEDLKLKDFLVGRSLTEKEVCASNFLKTFSDYCKTAAPFMQFLTEALELEW